MTDNLLDPGQTPVPDPVAEATEAPQPEALTAGRPDDVPEKFWDPEKGTLRTDALLKSYRELERKLGAQPAADIPAGPGDYALTFDTDLITADPEVNKRLHAAGFTHAQAQLVYDLAKEHLTPMVGELASVFEAESQVQRLTEYFGGSEKWRETARQIAAWGQSRFAENVFSALSSTYEGVVAMHRMMQSDEPDLIGTGRSPETAASESALRQMMRDPRYWRDQDPGYVARVEDGFRRLYPD